jgi:nucleotide-binding universal stress UspA family protein
VATRSRSDSSATTATAQPAVGSQTGTSDRGASSALHRIVVGVDGSDSAAGALTWAARLAGVTSSEVVVAHAFEPDQAEVSPERSETMKRDAESRLADEWSAPLRERDVRYRPLLVEGLPAVLLDVADEVDAGLVVVGPKVVGDVAALHIGSLAHHLAHHTRRPLAIVSARAAPAGFDRIVVGVDGSDGSAAAVDWCAEVARAANAEVLAVYAFEPLVEWVPESDPRSWHQVVEREMTEWVAPLRAAGVPVATRIMKDTHPVAALANAIEHDRADLVVVGTRGRGGLGGLRLGHVAIQLVHHAHIPVVLVPVQSTIGRTTRDPRTGRATEER